MALITNPLFRDLDWVHDIARKSAQKLLDEDKDASGLLDLSAAEAYEMLVPVIPQFIKAQKATGLWRVKDAEHLSLALLKALDYTNLLGTVAPQLRCDPCLPFREAGDWYSIAVRRLLQEPREDEEAVKARLLEEIAGRQLEDGSWEHTVVATVHHLEMLAATGLSDTPCFTRGINFLFTCIQPEVPSLSRAAEGLPESERMLAHDMITSDRRRAEFRSALAYKPYWIPVGACYSHLPMMQTGYALHLLNKTGYENDPRVVKACQNLVDLHERFGGWCQSSIHYGLLAEKKARKAQR